METVVLKKAQLSFLICLSKQFTRQSIPMDVRTKPIKRRELVQVTSSNSASLLSSWTNSASVGEGVEVLGIGTADPCGRSTLPEGSTTSWLRALASRARISRVMASFNGDSRGNTYTHVIEIALCLASRALGCLVLQHVLSNLVMKPAFFGTGLQRPGMRI